MGPGGHRCTRQWSAHGDRMQLEARVRCTDIVCKRLLAVASLRSAVSLCGRQQPRLPRLLHCRVGGVEEVRNDADGRGRHTGRCRHRLRRRGSPIPSVAHPFRRQVLLLWRRGCSRGKGDGCKGARRNCCCLMTAHTRRHHHPRLTHPHGCSDDEALLVRGWGAGCGRAEAAADGTLGSRELMGGRPLRGWRGATTDKVLRRELGG